MTTGAPASGAAALRSALGFACARRSAHPPSEGRRPIPETRMRVRRRGIAHARTHPALECLARLYLSGRYTQCLELARQLQLSSTTRSTRTAAACLRAMALIDLGSGQDEVPELLDMLRENAPPDDLYVADIVEAEALFWSGRPERAVEVLTSTATRFGSHADLGIYAALVAGWSRYEIGEPVDADIIAVPACFPIGTVDVELRALAVMSRSAHRQAAVLFDTAATAWESLFTRQSLRCRWAACAARQAADGAENPEPALLRLEVAVVGAGLDPLLNQVRRSLRAAGVARSVSPRGGRRRIAELTPQEKNVLGMVGRGLTSLEIARCLGISPRTVNSHIGKARQKLGARTRVQAAAMVHDAS